MGDRIDFPTFSGLTPPMLYVLDKTEWEYKVIACDVANALGEEELNALGKEGWELAGVMTHDEAAHFYFKRIKD